MAKSINTTYLYLDAGRNRAGSFLLECIPSPPSEASHPSFLVLPNVFFKKGLSKRSELPIHDFYGEKYQSDQRKQITMQRMATGSTTSNA